MSDHARNEWIAEALDAAQDEMEYEAMRNLDLGLEPGYVSTDEMIRHANADRAEPMAEYDPRDFGWWDSERQHDR
jgi:hypothetical protein